MNKTRKQKRERKKKKEKELSKNKPIKLASNQNVCHAKLVLEEIKRCE